MSILLEKHLAVIGAGKTLAAFWWNGCGTPVSLKRTWSFAIPIRHGQRSGGTLWRSRGHLA